MTKSRRTVEEIGRNRQAWTATIILTFIVGFFFLRPFISLILLAALMAFFTNPIYQWLVRKFNGKTGLAALLTTVALFLIVALPVAIVLAVAAAQAVVLVNDLGIGNLFEGNFDPETKLLALTNDANNVIYDVAGVHEVIKPESVSTFVKGSLPDVINFITNSILSLAASIPAFITNLIIFLFVYIGILTNSKQLLETLHHLSPFDRKINNLYLRRVGVMASGMLKGQFIIALAQGLATAIGLAAVGLSSYFFFFFMIFTFLSLIPLGAGIISIPLGIIALLTGFVWQGLVILGNHFVVVTNIDNIRPKLVPKEARMQSALTILAAFSGLYFFGLVGVIYGPVIMIVLVTTIETYIKVKDENFANEGA